MRKPFVKAIIILLVNVFLFSVAYLAATLMADRRMPATRNQFMSKEAAEFYRRYALELNHLREPQLLVHLPPEIKGTMTDFLFTRIGSGEKTVLIQGDSWAEQFVTSLGSYVTLEGYADANDVTFVAAGVASYAPSPMAVQYRILRENFGIVPRAVIAIIDQTDVADETCRYRNQMATNANGKPIVRPYESDDTQPFSVLPYLNQIAILDEEGSALNRLLKYKLNKLMPVNSTGCSLDQIAAPMRGKLTDEDQAYFLERLQDYITTVFDQAGQDLRLMLVTHYHRSHLTGEYSRNVSTLVKEAIEQSPFRDRIDQVDFSPVDYGSARVDDVFKAGDPWSHLTDAAHRRIYARKILARLNALISN